jgi:hypothetical protein
VPGNHSLAQLGLQLTRCEASVDIAHRRGDLKDTSHNS